MARIGVLTAGGDAPGLNAVIRAVVKTARRAHGWDVIGVEGGFEGLLSADSARSLDLDDVRGLLPRGGSILGCTSRGHFRMRQDGESRVEDEAAFAGAVETVARHELLALLCIGGDGSQRIAHELGRRGVPVIGIPKTIDNDLRGTERTFGFDSAVAFATDALDRLHTTAESHGRILVVEVMGRNAGWIALEAGVAGGADVVLVPERPFRLAEAAAHIDARRNAGRHFSIVVCAEGAVPEGGQVVHGAPAAVGAEPRLGGIGLRVADELERRTGRECRVATLGHLQRGGSPSASDRLLASTFGAAAVHGVSEGRFDQMVAVRGGTLDWVPLADVVGGHRPVPRDHILWRVAADLGISFAAA